MNDYTIPFRETEDNVLECILSRIPISEKDVFLDIGCGNGIVLERVAQTHPNVSCIGIEIDGCLVTNARNRLQSYPNVQVFHEDLRTITWSDILPQAEYIYCFLAWTKTYLREFDFTRFPSNTVWIVFKHELPSRTYTEKICFPEYAYNNVYIYRP